jgi:hypothetical protein
MLDEGANSQARKAARRDEYARHVPDEAVLNKTREDGVLLHHDNIPRAALGEGDGAAGLRVSRDGIHGSVQLLWAIGIGQRKCPSH